MKRVRVRGWWFFALVAVAVMVIPWPEWLIESVYSRGFYPRWQRLVTASSNIAGFAIVDLLLTGLALYLVWLIVRFVRRMKERGFGAASWELGRRVVRTAAWREAGLGAGWPSRARPARPG